VASACSVEVVVGFVGDVGVADDAGGTGISIIVADKTI
jgi:hypothetical protein